MDLKKLYGIVSAVGKRLGDAEQARGGVLQGLRATGSRDEFAAFLRNADTGLPDALLDGLAGELTEENWQQWKARVVLQTKMVAAGAKPAPGHETGRGTGAPGSP